MLKVKEVLYQLKSHNVQYIIIGGMAAIAQGSAHVTEDIDICYTRDRENLVSLVKALSPFAPYLRGAPKDLPFIFDAKTLENGLNFTLSTDVGDIDLLGEVYGIGDYTKVLEFSEILEIYGFKCPVLTLEGLIKTKSLLARPKDMRILTELSALLQIRNEKEEKMKDINLLVCEDDEDICRTFSQYLESEGYGVERALNGREALQKAKEKRFSIALIDIMMPEMDGIEVMKRLKEITPDIDAVIITAHSSFKTAIAALKLGAYDYLQKPVNLDDVGKLVKGIIHQQELIEAERASVACIKAKLKKAAEENAKLIEEIESLCESKENLLIDISHGLRTPVTIIQGYSEILLEKAGDAETRKCLRVIIEQCQSLTDLADKAIGE